MNAPSSKMISISSWALLAYVLGCSSSSSHDTNSTTSSSAGSAGAFGAGVAGTTGFAGAAGSLDDGLAGAGNCVIESTLYLAGVSKPDNDCLTCQPSVTSSAWVPVTDGTTCGAGKICHTGLCQAGCRIDGVYVAAEQRNGANPCETCQPALSTSGWSPVVHCIQSLSAGLGHTCAVADGTVQCWGDNSKWQLGNSTTTTATAIPAPVQGLAAGARAVAAGLYHSCAVVNTGVQCWGDNRSGQLGNGSTTNSLAPVTFQGTAAGASAVVVGSSHTCTLSNGGVQCAGANGSGQLGNRLTLQSPIPVTPEGLASGVIAIAAAQNQSCALVADGILCWGLNYRGQLGTNAAGDSLVPARVQGIIASAMVSAVANGRDHTCAIVGGGVQCWGDNSAGQLGNNSTAQSLSPVPVQGLSIGVRGIAAGGSHTCAVLDSGIACWGSNGSGQLGDGTTIQSPVPVYVKGLGPGVVQSVTTGEYHTCAVLDGVAYCWGSNGYGQLGNSLGDSAIPVRVQLR